MILTSLARALGVQTIGGVSPSRFTPFFLNTATVGIIAAAVQLARKASRTTDFSLRILMAYSIYIADEMIGIVL